MTAALINFDDARRQMRRRERQQRAMHAAVAAVFAKLVDGPLNEADAKAVGELAFEVALANHPQLFDEGEIQNDTSS